MELIYTIHLHYCLSEERVFSLLFLKSVLQFANKRQEHIFMSLWSTITSRPPVVKLSLHFGDTQEHVHMARHADVISDRPPSSFLLADWTTGWLCYEVLTKFSLLFYSQCQTEQSLVCFRTDDT